MHTTTTKDGTQPNYEDWGKGEPIVFFHGWPLSFGDRYARTPFILGHGSRTIGACTLRVPAAGRR
jgi:pimeloyl-ACP methyl ester carboxylesterase